MTIVPLIACIGLVLVSFFFAFLSLAGGNRALPRWIRVALLMIALSQFTAAITYAVLCLVADRLSPSMHRLVFDIVLFVGGAGAGIFFLLAISGEYARAVRDLDSLGRKRSPNTREVSGHEHV